MTIVRFDNLPAIAPSGTVKVPALDGTTKGHILASDLVGQPGADGVDGTNGTNGTDGINGTNGVDGVDGQDFTGLTLGAVQTSSFTAVSGFRYPIDLSGATDPSNITITLPADADGNRFAFYDQTASMTATVTATITGLIEGEAASDLVLDTKGVKVEIAYEDNVYGYSVDIR